MAPRKRRENAMRMDDLWFDMAMRGERDLGKDAMVRLHLSDGRESGPKGDKPQAPPPDLEGPGGARPSLGVDLC
jgi:hypothetical protein